MIPYAVNSIAWSIAGFSVGVWFAKKGGGIVATVKNGSLWQRIKNGLKKAGLGTFLVVFALITVGYQAYSNRLEAQTTACQAKFNQDSKAILLYRAKLSDEDRNSMIKLIKSVSTAKKPATVEAAIHTYIAETNASTAQRAKHPFPDLSERCG